MPGDFGYRLLEEQCRQNQRMQELIKQQQESTLVLTLPEPEVPTFNRDPIEYWTFVRAFENLIERKTTSESARLYYLVQYTTGEVRELVKSCLTMNPEEGYREARSLLKQRYGQGYRIATAYVDRLTRGPPIKAEDNAALRRFLILLTGCKNALKEIGYLNKAENPDTLKMIVNRVPPPNQAVNDQEVLNGYVEGRNESDRNHLSVTGLAVLPVRVKAPGCDKTVETYAFLDNGSTASFCSKELVRESGLSGRDMTLSLTTIEKEHGRTDCCIVSLEVLDLDEVNLIKLPSVFTRKKLPIEAENVATPQRHPVT